MRAQNEELQIELRAENEKFMTKLEQLTGKVTQLRKLHAEAIQEKLQLGYEPEQQDSEI